MNDITMYFWKEKHIVIRKYNEEVLWARKSEGFLALVKEFHNMPCWFDGVFWRFNYLGPHTVYTRVPKAFRMELMLLGFDPIIKPRSKSVEEPLP